jgi:hypothetical protein
MRKIQGWAIIAIGVGISIPFFALATKEKSIITVADTGINGSALSGAPETLAIDVRGSTGIYTQTTLFADVTAGTSTSMTMTCNGSPDGVTYYNIMSCLPGSAGAYTCSTWTPTYTLTTNTKIAINLPTNYGYIKCKFTASGNGTVVVTGYKSEV